MTLTGGAAELSRGFMTSMSKTQSKSEGERERDATHEFSTEVILPPRDHKQGRTRTPQQRTDDWIPEPDTRTDPLLSSVRRARRESAAFQIEIESHVAR